MMTIHTGAKVETDIKIQSSSTPSILRAATTEELMLLPQHRHEQLHLGKGWSLENQHKYSKHVERAQSSHGISCLEDPDTPMWSHRISLLRTITEPAQIQMQNETGKLTGCLCLGHCCNVSK